MSRRQNTAKRIGWLVLRWGVALGGMALVLSHVSLNDRVLLRSPGGGEPVAANLAVPAEETDVSFAVIDPNTKQVRRVGRDALVQRPGRPLVERGLYHMVLQADRRFLAASLLVYGVAVVLTARRWQQLLQAQGVRLSYGGTLAINMIGNFYGTFMPGSVGGDVFKAYYASRLTPKRTAAVLSVLVDRALGMLCLILLGGVMASWLLPQLPPHDVLADICRGVAIGSAATLVLSLISWSVIRFRRWRKSPTAKLFLSWLPLQKQVRSVIEAFDTYGTQPRLLLWGILVSLPVHVAVVISALLAGRALHLPLDSTYYFVAVPVIVLAGILPLTPQGVGVMELVAVFLVSRQSATVSQAFALATAIRLVPMLWNAAGGVFLLRGSYHTAPSLDQGRKQPAELPESAPQIRQTSL